MAVAGRVRTSSWRFPGRRVRLALLAGVVSWAPAVDAHDFFLLPGSFVTTGTRVPTIQATVGSSFPAGETALTVDRIERLYARGPGAPRLRADVRGACRPPTVAPMKLSTRNQLPGTVVSVTTGEGNV